MYGRIFGFQRLVWCPKWTPASIKERRLMGRSSPPSSGGSPTSGEGVASVAWISDIALHLRLRLRSPRARTRLREHRLVPFEPGNVGSFDRGRARDRPRKIRAASYSTHPGGRQPLAALPGRG